MKKWPAISPLGSIQSIPPELTACLWFSRCLVVVVASSVVACWLMLAGYVLVIWFSCCSYWTVGCLSVMALFGVLSKQHLLPIRCLALFFSHAIHPSILLWYMSSYSIYTCHTSFHAFSGDIYKIIILFEQTIYMPSILPYLILHLLWHLLVFFWKNKIKNTLVSNIG